MVALIPAPPPSAPIHRPLAPAPAPRAVGICALGGPRGPLGCELERLAAQVLRASLTKLSFLCAPPRAPGLALSLRGLQPVQTVLPGAHRGATPPPLPPSLRPEATGAVPAPGPRNRPQGAHSRTHVTNQT